MGLLRRIFRTAQPRRPGKRAAFRRALPSLAMAAACPLLGALSAPPPSEWPQFRGDPALNGVAAAALPEKLELKWSISAGSGIDSSAAIVGGMVFITTHDGDLQARRLSDGGLVWKYSTGSQMGESSPAVSAGLVYVGDLAGVVHAVAAADGQARWTFSTGTEIKASPVVVEGKVLIGSYDEHLYGLDAASGRLLWKLRTQGPVHCTAGVAQGTTYISGCDEQFRAVRIADGSELFVVPSGSYTAASPALQGGRAYYGTFNNEVVAVDLSSRRILWTYRHPQREFPFYSSAAVRDDRLVIGGRDKMVHCLETATGKALWTFTTRSRVESSPVIAGERVYVGSNDGRLYVLNLADGTKVWEFNTGSAITASPAIASGRLVIGALDGTLYCFG